MILVWRGTTRGHFHAQVRVYVAQAGGHEHGPGDPVIILRVRGLPEKSGTPHAGWFGGSTVSRFKATMAVYQVGNH